MGYLSLKFALTERAIRSLRRAAVDNKELESSSDVPIRTRLPPPFAVGSIRLERSEYLFLTVVTVVESYLDSLSLARLFHSRSTNRRVRQNLQRIATSSSLSWKNRENAFAAYHNVDLTQLPSYKKLRAATTVRNCIAHGLGELTQIQLVDENLFEQLATFSIGVDNRRIVLAKDTINLLLTTCEQFLLEVDATFPNDFQFPPPISAIE